MCGEGEGEGGTMCPVVDSSVTIALPRQFHHHSNLKKCHFFSPCKIILSLTFFSEEGSLLFQRAAHNSGIV